MFESFGSHEGCFDNTVIICFWLVVVGCWWLVAGCWFFFFFFWLLVVGCWLLVLVVVVLVGAGCCSCCLLMLCCIDTDRLIRAAVVVAAVGLGGCADSIEHAVILSQLPAMLKKTLGPTYAGYFAGVTNIDDVLTRLESASEWDERTVTEVWNSLDRLYKNHGYVLDKAKSGASYLKQFFLGCGSVTGIEIPSSVKTLAKGGEANINRPPGLIQETQGVYAYLRSGMSTMSDHCLAYASAFLRV